MTASVVFIIFGFMSKMVKSLADGHWYYEETPWDYVHFRICDAIRYFSESDMNSEEYIILSHLADVVFAKVYGND